MNKVLPMQAKTLDSLIILLITLALFMFNLSGQEVIGFDSRFYLFAQEMWQNGLSWFPTTYQQPYPDYPATSTAIIYLLAKLFGGLSKPIAVFPSALMAAITLTLTYCIGALQSRRYGWYAVFMLLLTFAFVHSARAIALDMYPAAITTACFYLIYAADVKKHPAPFFSLYCLIILGFILRGPIGLIMPTGVICVYYLLDGQFKRLLRVGITAFILLIISCALFAALAYHVGGAPFLQSVLRMEVAGRMNAPTVPRFYYFTTAIIDCALSYPLAIIVIVIAFFYAFRRGSASTYTHLILKLTGWMLVILIGMSIPGDKKIRYILPMLPAAALLSAYLFIAPAHHVFFKTLRWMLLRSFFILPTLFIAAIIFLFIRHPTLLLIAQVPLYALISVLLMLQVANILVVMRNKARRGLLVTAFAVMSFLCILYYVIEPIELNVERAKDVVMTIEATRTQQRGLLIFYRESPDGMPIKYLINMPELSSPLFINETSALEKLAAPAIIITSVSHYEALPTSITDKMTVITKDTLGHVPIVVFSPTTSTEKQETHAKH